MFKNILLSMLLTVLSFNSFAGWNPDESNNSVSNDNPKIFLDTNSGMKKFYDKAYGYAYFPEIGKAGIGFGGAYGNGVVYEKGKRVGTSSLAQVSFGFQLGAQLYREIIFFKDKETFKNFTKGNFELGAQASAVALTQGVSVDADYDNGVAVFTMPKKGLMYEAAVAGQKFDFNAD